jgi:hypothetical protein
MSRMLECPDCGKVFKEPLIKEKRIGFNFTLGLPAITTCHKCAYKADSPDFSTADSFLPATT